MIEVNVEKALPIIDKSQFELHKQRAYKAFQEVKDKSGKGAEWLGWRDLLATPDKSVLDDICRLTDSIREDADIFIVCGIGGSYLGARAVIEALSSFYRNNGEVEILYAGHHLSGRYLKELIDYINKPKSNGSSKSVYVNVISKSGTTLETALAFRTLRKWMHQTYGEKAKNRIFCTTSASGGALNSVIKQQGYRKFIIPDDVGGRFSVLTPVGLLPIAMAGIDVRALLQGAVDEFKKLENNGKDIINYAAIRYLLYQKGKEIDVISTFEPELHYLTKWMQQLLGESEGKDGKGIFPTVASYSTDLHSLGQMIQQGERNMMETFIKVKHVNNRLLVEELEQNNDGLNYLSGKSFCEINEKAFRGTRQAHVEGKVPTITVTMEKLDVENIGRFIYFYELFTAIFVYCLGVNPFNQPGVEAYKKAMYRLLGKS